MLGAALVIGAGCAAPVSGMRPRPGGCRRCARSAGCPTRGICGTGRCWCSHRHCWATRWGWPAGWQRPSSPAGWRCSPCVSSRTRCDSPLRCAALPWRSLALGGVATAVAVCVGVALLAVVPAPVGRGAPAAALTITAAPVPAGSDIDAYDAAVQHAFAQVQAAVAASADLKAVPSNLDPPLADAAAEHKAMLLNGCLRNPFQVGQPECATGDTASTTTVALVGDSHAAMWSPAFQQVAAQRHWRLEMLAKAACPLMDLPIANPFRRVVEHFEHCEQWRGQIIARLRAEHPRLVVVSMWRGYGAGRIADRLQRLRPGVDRQPDPPRAAAARHRCAGAGARADPGSALGGADLPVRAPR